MLPKSRRIPRESFKPLLLSRKYLNSEHFSLRVAPSTKPRVAVSVSKKVSKKAVVRNRVRRRVYSVTATIFPQLSNNLFLLIAKPRSEKVKGQELKDELAKLFKKV